MCICDESNVKWMNLTKTENRWYEWNKMIVMNRMMSDNRLWCNCINEMLCMFMIYIYMV